MKPTTISFCVNHIRHSLWYGRNKPAERRPVTTPRFFFWRYDKCVRNIEHISLRERSPNNRFTGFPQIHCRSLTFSLPVRGLQRGTCSRFSVLSFRLDSPYSKETHTSGSFNTLELSSVASFVTRNNTLQAYTTSTVWLWCFFSFKASHPKTHE